MRVAIIGDLFLKNELIEKILIRYLGDGEDIKLTGLKLNWPRQPLISDGEVKEYIGNEKEVLTVARDAEILITHLAPVTRRVIWGCPKLKIIACCRGGVVNVNIKAATQRKIPVLNTPGRNKQAAAEFTLAMILCLLKPIIPAHQALKKGIWRGDFYEYDKCAEELAGKKVGLIGFGLIGKRVCQLLSPFNVEVLVFDPYVEKKEVELFGARLVELEKLLRESHIISLHARLTPETYKLIGEREISMMRPGAYLINTARGGLVDYEALYKALKEGKLKGAALDTFDPEPPSTKCPLLSLSNVVLTPHLAGASRETASHGIEMLARGISKYLQGEIPENCVNPEVFQ